MNFRNPYFTEEEKIGMLQRWIIVQSRFYYDTDIELVSDKVYDDNCRQLVDLQNQFREAFKRSQYYYMFYDFDGTTGFHLYNRLTEPDRIRIDNIVNMLMRLRHGES
ncbi:MAG: hypothetical protein GX896_09980 [Clostridiales bacterium]|nr:hypothetical protein [Clostridiales bacterium]